MVTLTVSDGVETVPSTLNTSAGSVGLTVTLSPAFSGPGETTPSSVARTTADSVKKDKV